MKEGITSIRKFLIIWNPPGYLPQTYLEVTYILNKWLKSIAKVALSVKKKREIRVEVLPFSNKRGGKDIYAFDKVGSIVNYGPV